MPKLSWHIIRPFWKPFRVFLEVAFSVVRVAVGCHTGLLVLLGANALVLNQGK